MTTSSNTPLLDIVVLVYNVPSWTAIAIKSIEEHTKNPYRLILVDSASTDPATLALLNDAEKRGHTVVHLAENKSFSTGVNAGMSVGSAPFVCVFNNDAIALEGWDGALLQDASEKSVGLVGARSNYASGAQGDPSWDGAEEPPFLVFVCVAMRREVWNQVGPLDSENFTGFSSEDLDYSWRVKTAGFKLKVSNAYVLHAGSRTIASSMDAEAQLRNNLRYNAVLVSKWGKDFIPKNTKLKQRALVTTYHGENFTRVEFMKNLMGLRNNPKVNFEYLQVVRAPIHIARQLAADFALDGGFDWWVQLDDDATFPPDVLSRLLHHQKDVVCALAYQRKTPYGTCAFEIGPDGVMGAHMEGIEHTGLRKVDVSGFHCSIMRTSVIQKLRDGVRDADGKVIVPGTRHYFGGFGDAVGEDFALSFLLKKIGVSIYVDTDLVAGHIGAEIVVDEAFKRDWNARGRPG